MRYSVKTNGRQVIRSIKAIDGQVEDKLKSALRQASSVVLKKAREEAPIGDYTGAGGLRQSIDADYSRLHQFKTAIYTAGKKYAPWIHEGTGIYGKFKRPIRPKTAKVLKFKVNGKWIAKREVKGVKPNPYLSRALQQSIPSIKSIFRHYFKK